MPKEVNGKIIVIKIAADENHKRKFDGRFPLINITFVRMEKIKINFDKMTDAINKKGGRMAFCPGLKAKNLDNGGVLAEDKEELNHRLGKMEAKLKNVAGFKITSVYGTNLEIKMKPGERRWFKENGELKPGTWGNLPGGEIFTTPDEEEVNGILVLPVLTE